MISLRKVLIVSIISMAYGQASFGGRSIMDKFKKLNGNNIFPNTDFNTYKRPELVSRSTIKENDDGSLELVEVERQVLYKRNELNVTEIAKQFMSENYPNIEYIFTDIMDFKESSIASVHMAQSINDVEILNTAININIDKLSGAIISSGVSIWEDIAIANNAISQPMDVKEAILIANNDLELYNGPIDVDALEIENLFDNRLKVKNVPYSHDGTLMAKKLFIGINGSEAEEVWELIVEIDIDLIVILVSINSRSVIQIQDHTNHAVYKAVPLNMPNIGNSARETFEDPYIKRYSPLGWHNNNKETFTDTKGNNVEVIENSDGDEGLDGNHYINGGDDLNFVFNYDESKTSVEGNQGAAAANVFYITNVLHDLYYKLGFTEAYGNFQRSNFGREGKDDDPLIVIVNDRFKKNNAQMQTTVDGVSPKLRLYPFIKDGVERDPAFDNQIIIHEYTHGVSNRLVGGPSKIYCLVKPESNALNEGYSDFFANALQYKKERGRNAPVYLFQYVIDKGRTYPITCNMDENPLTYEDLTHYNTDDDNEQFTYVGNEVWSAILNEIFWNVIEEFKDDEEFYKNEGPDVEYSPSNFVVMKIVIDSIKLLPCNPKFIEARDSILVAVDNNNEPEKVKCLFWVGFAKRGLGYKATKGKSHDEDGKEKIVYTNDFSVPSECEQYVNF